MNHDGTSGTVDLIMKHPVTSATYNSRTYYTTSWTTYGRSDLAMAGYDNCYIREALLKAILPGFGQNVQSAIVPMKFTSSSYNSNKTWDEVSFNDKIKIPSLKELGLASDPNDLNSSSSATGLINDGSLYPIFKNNTNQQYNINAYLPYIDTSDEYLSLRNRYRGYYTRSRFSKGTTLEVWNIILVIASYTGDNHTINGVYKGAYGCALDAFDDTSTSGCVAIIRFGKQ